MKRVSQAPWFIVLCVSISELSVSLSEILFLSLVRSRGVSLSLGSRARACQEARLALGARRPPRGRAVADQLSLLRAAS